jgi:peptide/nickel transport system substrate-binding protein
VSASSGQSINTEQYDYQVLRYGTQFLVDQYSYFTRANFFTSKWLSLIYSGLYQRADDGSWEPELAASQPEISPDGKDWIVHLRQDLQFPYGTLLTADDVVFSYQLLLTPELNLNSYDTLVKKLDSNDSVAKIDDYTVRFTFNTGDVFNQQLLAEPVFSKRLFENDYTRCLSEDECDWNDPSGYYTRGIGPFVLEKIVLSQDQPQKVSLVKNPNYWNNERIWVSKIECIHYDNTETLIEALQSKKIDLVQIYEFPDYKELMNSQGIYVTITDDTTLQEISINHLHPFFGTGEKIPDNGRITGDAEQARLLRQAMSRIVNRTRITSSDYPHADWTRVTRPASSPVPAGSVGWDSSLEPVEFNLTQAREIMTDIGFEYDQLEYDSLADTYTSWFFNITMLTPQFPNYYSYIWLDEFLSNLPRIGIGVSEYISTGWDTIIPRTFGSGDKPPVYDEGGYDLFAIGYDMGLDWDPDGLYISNGLCGTGTCDNFYNYYNQTVEDMISAYCRTFEFSQRLEQVKELQHTLAHELPVIPVFNNQFIWAYQSTIESLNLWLFSLDEMSWVDVKKNSWSAPAVIDQLPILSFVTGGSDKVRFPFPDVCTSLIMIPVLRHRWKRDKV